jgi:NAD(P)-dependent dehydrogenase (short-subunit alcohol dehydrogenase family)
VGGGGVADAPTTHKNPYPELTYFTIFSTGERMRLDSEKAVLVTGASTGIGEASALHLDALGFKVYAGVRRTADGEALRGKGSDRLTPVIMDVTDPGTIADAAGRIEREMGASGLFGLVNNAGVAVAAPIEFLPLEDLRRQLEVNVIGQVAVIQACLPLLRAARGRIVNISSISGRYASPFLSPYSCSKFALESISDSLRVELRPWDIAVIVLEPGSIATPIWEKSLAAAREMIQKMPPRAKALYGVAMDHAIQSIFHMGQRGIPVSAVARVVAQVLTARRPKARYPIGRGVRLAIILSFLAPAAWRDQYIARRFGME